MATQECLTYVFVGKHPKQPFLWKLDITFYMSRACPKSVASSAVTACHHLHRIRGKGYTEVSKDQNPVLGTSVFPI